MNEGGLQPNTTRVLTSMGVAAFGSGALITVFTTPQIISLSQKSSSPLPKGSGSIFKRAGIKIFQTAILTQTINKLLHFGSVRILKDALDDAGAFGAYNINVAYGLVSIPMQAWSYNSLNADVFRHFGKSQPQTGTVTALAADFFNKKIRPGFVWTFLRDSHSIGGGLLLGPIVAGHIVKARSGALDQPSRGDRLAGGLVAGIFCGFGTQMPHNAALVAGRAAELGERLTTTDCFRRMWSEIGGKCFYQGFPHRVMVIAGISGVLNLCEPFK